MSNPSINNWEDVEMVFKRGAEVNREVSNLVDRILAQHTFKDTLKAAESIATYPWYITEKVVVSKYRYGSTVHMLIDSIDSYWRNIGTVRGSSQHKIALNFKIISLRYFRQYQLEKQAAATTQQGSTQAGLNLDV